MVGENLRCRSVAECLDQVDQQHQYPAPAEIDDRAVEHLAQLLVVCLRFLAAALELASVGAEHRDQRRRRDCFQHRPEVVREFGGVPSQHGQVGGEGVAQPDRLRVSGPRA